MAKLIGAQRMVLQAILDAQGETTNFMTDQQVAQATQIAIKDVRDWLETLESSDYVTVARTTAGLSVSITANGRLALGQFRPFSDPTPGPPAASPPTTTGPPSPMGASSPPLPKSTGQPGPGQTFPHQPIRLFYSYSHQDEELRKELENHLSLLRRRGLIAGWHDRMIGAGDEWKGEIDKNLEEAQVVLLLVSASFLASDYCWDIETKRAIERHDRGEVMVIPVILRPCDWQGAPFGKIQSLPRDGKAITSWQNRDEAFTDVTLGIRWAVEAMTANPR